MSHHFDTAIAREDPRLNICDFYLFRGQSGTTVMAMTVNPNAGTKAPDTFHEEGLYAFRFDVNDDAHEEVTFKIRFGEVGHAGGEGTEGRHVQTLEVRRATGEGCRRRHGGRGHRFGHYRADRRGRRGCADLRWPGPGSVRCGPDSSGRVPRRNCRGAIRTGRCFTTARTTSKTAT